MRRGAARADREREHALLAVAVVGDDAPAHAVRRRRASGLQRDRRASRPCDDGLAGEHRRSASSLSTAAFPRRDAHACRRTSTVTAVGAFASTAPFAGVVWRSVACANARAAAATSAATTATRTATGLTRREATAPRPRASLAASVPIYEYKCPNGHLFEVFHGMTEDGPAACEVCGAAPLQRSCIRSRCTTRARASTRPTTAASRRKAAKDGGSSRLARRAARRTRRLVEAPDSGSGQRRVEEDGRSLIASIPAVRLAALRGWNRGSR